MKKFERLVFRISGGLTGVTLLYFLYDSIIVKHEPLIPKGGGYYGPLLVPMSLYIAITFIAYACDAQKFLRKFAPRFADKLVEDEKKVQDEQQTKEGD